MIQTRTLKLYQPHSVQDLFHACQARYRVAAWGRQSGKSTASLNDLLRFAWRHPGVTLWYVSPTIKQAKVQYRRLLGMLWRSRHILTKKNQTELRLKLINQSQIQFVSGEVLDNLRGETLHGAVIDEVRDQHPDLWPMVIRPMLSTTGGWSSFVSTPNGFDIFYDLYERAQSDTRGRWAAFQAPSTANPLFTQEEYEEARATMSEGQFAQEILAEFRDLHRGKAYVNYGEHNHRLESPFARVAGETVNPYLPIVIGLDFNISPMAWTLGQVRGRQSYWFEEIWLEGSHTPEASQELVSRLTRLRDAGHMKLHPQIVLVGDATGGARQRAAAGKSDYDILCAALTRAGFTWENRTPDSNPPVKDRVNTLNACLKAADGSVFFHFHPVNCPHLRRDLQRVTFKPNAEATLDQTTDPMLTHSSDGVGYALCVLTPIPDINPVGGLTIIRR